VRDSSFYSLTKNTWPTSGNSSLGGKNAEAYFSFDGKKLIFQATREGFQCDQIFIMNDDGKDIRLVSTGKGQTTCAYFFPDGRRILYSSTHYVSPDCPPARPREKRFIWPLYPYEIFTAKADGSGLKPLTHTGSYYLGQNLSNVALTVSMIAMPVKYSSQMRSGK